jgi:hypothetical protein
MDLTAWIDMRLVHERSTETLRLGPCDRALRRCAHARARSRRIANPKASSGQPGGGGCSWNNLTRLGGRGSFPRWSRAPDATRMPLKPGPGPGEADLIDFVVSRELYPARPATVVSEAAGSPGQQPLSAEWQRRLPSAFVAHRGAAALVHDDDLSRGGVGTAVVAEAVAASARKRATRWFRERIRTLIGTRIALAKPAPPCFRA